ncbi:MAG: hypothetical protein QOH93_169 [Chloroflexia bacterium]|nr:hypothetical protein [Chloroflexia bacterium]
MLVYFLRRILSSLIRLLLAFFTLYHLLVYFPGGAADRTKFEIAYQVGGHGAGRGRLLQQINFANLDQFVIKYLENEFAIRYPTAAAFQLHKAWPANFLTYLFDPNDVLEVNSRNEVVEKGIDLNIFGIRVRGSGPLTGDFGDSTVLVWDSSPTEAIGPGFHYIFYIFAFLLASILTFMYVALVQRIGRPTPYIPPHQSGTLASKSHLFLDPVGFALQGRLSRA